MDDKIAAELLENVDIIKNLLNELCWLKQIEIKLKMCPEDLKTYQSIKEEFNKLCKENAHGEHDN